MTYAMLIYVLFIFIVHFIRLRIANNAFVYHHKPMTNVNTPKQAIEYLLSSGLTQSQIAAQSGVQQGTISRIASGLHKDPRLSTAQRIFAAVNRMEISKQPVAPNTDKRRKSPDQRATSDV